MMTSVSSVLAAFFGVEWADALRLFTMMLGGLAVGLKVPILRHHVETLHWIRRGRLRYDDVAGPILLRAVSHVLAVLFICVNIATKIGDELTWQTPAALVVFIATITGLIYTHRSDKEVLGAVREDEAVEELKARALTTAEQRKPRAMSPLEQPQ